MMISLETRLDLLEAENKLDNISTNSLILKGKIREALTEDKLTNEQLKEINEVNNLLSDYVIDTAELLTQCLRSEERAENETEIPAQIHGNFQEDVSK